MMELTFQKLLYDDSLDKPKRELKNNTKESYAGLDKIRELLKAKGAVSWEQNVVRVNGITFVFRYSATGATAFGGISEINVETVFCIRKMAENKYQMVAVDVKEEMTDKIAAGSWSVSQDQWGQEKYEEQELNGLIVKEIVDRIGQTEER